MKKHFIILLTSIFMGLVFALGLNTEVKAAQTAWSCTENDGRVTLSGSTCFFNAEDTSLNINGNYVYLDFTFTPNSNSNLLNLYYKDIVKGGNSYVSIDANSNSQTFQMPISVNEDFQTVEVYYILGSNPSKVQKIILDIAQDSVAPSISLKVESGVDSYTNKAQVKYSIADDNADDSGLMEVKFLWRKTIISLPKESEFASKTNEIESINDWVTRRNNTRIYTKEKLFGNYQLCALAKDAANNTTIKCSDSVKMDTIAPALEYYDLKDTSKWYSEYKVTYKAFDNSGNYKLTYYVDGEEFKGSNGFVLNENVSDGIYTVYIKAEDEAGNVTTTEPISVKIVNTPITATLKLEGTIVNGIYKGKATSIIEINSPLNYKLYWKTIEGEDWKLAEEIIFNPIKVSVLEDGEYKFGWKIVDEAGREAIFESEKVTVDATAPTIKVINLTGENEYGWYNQDFGFELEVTDTTDKITYSTDKSSYDKEWLDYDYEEVINYLKSSNGQVSVWFRETDRVGYTGTTSFTIKVDNRKDGIVASWDKNILAGTKNVYVEIRNSTSPILKLSYIDLSTLEEKEIIDKKFEVSKNGQYKIIVQDQAGNEATLVITINDFYDFSQEYLLKAENVAWTNQNVKVSLINNGTSKVVKANVKHNDANVDFSLETMSFEAEENGTYLVSFENENGYKDTLEINITNIDKEQDTIIINDNNVVGSWIGNYSFSVSVTQKGTSPVGKAFYTLIPDILYTPNGEEIELPNFDTTITLEDISGEYYLLVIYKDEAGNVTEKLSSLIKLDSSLPVNGKIIAFPSDYTNEDIIIAFKPFENVTVSGKINHYYRLTKVGESQSEFILIEDIENFIYTIEDEGEYIIDLKGVNEFGKEGITSLYVTKDVTKPIITLDNASKDEYSNKIEIIVSVNEEAVIEYQIVEFDSLIDENNYIALEGNAIYSDTLSTGKYLVVVKATDEAGNVQIAKVTCNIDSEKPVVSFTDEDSIYDKGEGIGFTASDNDAIKSIKYLISKEEIANPDFSKGFAVSESKIDLPEMEDGKYYIYLEVVDKVGNRTVISKLITLDSTAPLIEGVVNNGYYNKSLTLKIEELTTYQLYLNNKLTSLTENSLELTENGYYNVYVVDYLGHFTYLTFIINLENKITIGEKEVNVSNQKYLPILKDSKGYYVQLPAISYPEKKVLVFSKSINNEDELLNQDPNYLYLSSSVRNEAKKEGYRFEINDNTAILEEADEQGYYGYIVVNTMSLNQANKLGISPVVIDNKAVSLITGITGLISVVGIFVINRSRKVVRV